MQTGFLKAGVLLTALLLTACQTEQESSETTISTVSETVTESDHSLLRPFTINEAFEQITVSGEKFIFPFALTELDEGGTMEGYKYENGVLYFPDGGTAQAEVKNGMVYFMKFSQGTAPIEFSLMDITLGLSYDIIYSVGIPDETETIGECDSLWYMGTYGQYFRLDFNNKRLTDITIVQQ